MSDPSNERPSRGENDDAQRRSSNSQADASEAAEKADAQATALASERDELLAQLARARADYQNLRKRTQVDIDNAVRRSLENLLQNLFVVVDNLDFALKVEALSDDARQLAHGVELTRMQFLHALAQEGAAPIPDGETFDPKLHEAVATIPTSDRPAGSIVQVLRRGWTWRGTVLRPTHVQVAAAPSGSSETPSANESSGDASN